MDYLTIGLATGSAVVSFYFAYKAGYDSGKRDSDAVYRAALRDRRTHNDLTKDDLLRAELKYESARLLNCLADGRISENEAKEKVAQGKMTVNDFRIGMQIRESKALSCDEKLAEVFGAAIIDVVKMAGKKDKP